MNVAKRPAPHDTLGGPNDDIRNFEIEVLSDGWYTLRRATFDRRQPDGSWKPESREAYDRGNGACALLRDPQTNTVLLVRQYRLPAHVNEHGDGMLIEVPGGLVDADEGVSEAIQRELEEEVGHDIDDLHQVFSLYMSPGSVTEHVTFFVGTYSGASRVNAGGGAEAEGELVEVLEVPFDEALAMTTDGRIVDGKTVILLLWAKLNLLP
jgi:nudix-type nucleoside diphosphatase (YffH/AdpP family)